tara:strand:- start:3033 stop:3281 length:249 start_codon:yes stop_codon:yes gene_type:complete
MPVEIFVIAAIVMGGCAYTSYRIGFREGSGSMIDFVKSKRNKAGYTTMHFFGDHIEFVDHLEQMDKVLNRIVDKIEDDSREI